MTNNKINVRFAPSPTGMLHIGGARTALINKLFARKMGGNYHVRIEDTDKARSTDEATQAIKDGLKWLDLLPDDGGFNQQSKNLKSHAQKAEELVAKRLAYRCYETAEDLAQKRAEAEAKGEKYFYDRVWRDRDDILDKPYAIRLKMPLDGQTTIDDVVQGSVTIDNKVLDDYILMRADGSPTYMLSCVCDDVAMGISHIIRGDDHLNNAFRQKYLFEALGVQTPQFAHIPLLHGEDGKKLSKRHGAVAIGDYQQMGYLPEALGNYLLLLGWGKNEEEKFDWQSDDIAKDFDLSDLSKAPARFDFAKLNYLNNLYLRDKSVAELITLTSDFLEGQDSDGFTNGIIGLAERSNTLVEIVEKGQFYFHAPDLAKLIESNAEPKASKAIKADTATQALEILNKNIAAIPDSDADWNRDNIHQMLAELAESSGLGFGKIAQPLRVVLSGTMSSPDLSDIICNLGRDEVIERIDTGLAFIKNNPSTD